MRCSRAGLLFLAACTSSGGGEEPATYLYAGGGSTIDVFRLDPATGALTFLSETPAGDRAYLAAVDPEHQHLYVQTQLGLPVVIRSFAREADGALTAAADLHLPHPYVEGLTQLTVDPTSRWLLMSSTGGASGLLDQLVSIEAGGLGTPRTISSDFYGFAWDPSGRWLFGLDGVALLQYRFGATGAITPNEPPRAVGSEGHQLLALRTHPSGRWIYSIEERALGTFAFDTASGTLVSRGYAYNAVPGEAITWASLELHGSGRFLYALGSVTETQVALIDLFAIDGSGQTTFVTRHKGDSLHQIRLGSLQGPLVLGDLLIVGGQGTAGPYVGLPVLCVYRIAANGTLVPAGDPVVLRPAATAAVNFLFAAEGGALGPRNEVTEFRDRH
jgi:6-phosphogluconolactonase (cycloisomerase 2 family)